VETRFDTFQMFLQIWFKVVRQDGGELSFLTAGLRGSLGYWISSLLFNLGFLWAAFDQEKETWHDKIFKTWVVKT